MKSYSLFIFFLICLQSKSNCPDIIFDLDRTDTVFQVKQDSSLQILKCTPVQFFFGEIPLSWEIFTSKTSSIQFQIGVIIPLIRNPEMVNAIIPPPSRQLISQRTIPNNSYGISSRIELRRYGKKIYTALQCMYKYSTYSDRTFTIRVTNPQAYDKFKQTESKRSHVLGIGLMMGRQSYSYRYVEDYYWGLGLRLRIMKGAVTSKEYPYPYGRREEYTPYDIFSVYPFINFGVRIGSTFPKVRNT